MVKINLSQNFTKIDYIDQLYSSVGPIHAMSYIHEEHDGVFMFEALNFIAKKNNFPIRLTHPNHINENQRDMHWGSPGRGLESQCFKQIKITLRELTFEQLRVVSDELNKIVNCIKIAREYDLIFNTVSGSRLNDHDNKDYIANALKQEFNVNNDTLDHIQVIYHLAQQTNIHRFLAHHGDKIAEMLDFDYDTEFEQAKVFRLVVAITSINNSCINQQLQEILGNDFQYKDSNGNISTKIFRCNYNKLNQKPDINQLVKLCEFSFTALEFIDKNLSQKKMSGLFHAWQLMDQKLPEDVKIFICNALINIDQLQGLSTEVKKSISALKSQKLMSLLKIRYSLLTQNNKQEIKDLDIEIIKLKNEKNQQTIEQIIQLQDKQNTLIKKNQRNNFNPKEIFDNFETLWMVACHKQVKLKDQNGDEKSQEIINVIQLTIGKNKAKMLDLCQDISEIFKTILPTDESDKDVLDKILLNNQLIAKQFTKYLITEIKTQKDSYDAKKELAQLKTYDKEQLNIKKLFTTICGKLSESKKISCMDDKDIQDALEPLNPDNEYDTLTYDIYEQCHEIEKKQNLLTNEEIQTKHEETKEDDIAYNKNQLNTKFSQLWAGSDNNIYNSKDVNNQVDDNSNHGPSIVPDDIDYQPAGCFSCFNFCQWL